MKNYSRVGRGGGGVGVGIGSFLMLWKPFSAPFALWRGCFSLAFQSFVLSHLVFASVRMIAVGIIINFWETAHLPLP